MIDWLFLVGGAFLFVLVVLLLYIRGRGPQSNLVKVTTVLSANGLVDAFNRFQSQDVLPFIRDQVYLRHKEGGELKNLHQDATHMTFLDALSLLGEDLSPILLLYKEQIALPIEDVIGLAGQFYHLMMIKSNEDGTFSSFSYSKKAEHYVDYVPGEDFAGVIGKLEENDLGYCQTLVTSFFESAQLPVGRKYLDIRFYREVERNKQKRIVEHEVVVHR